MIRAKTITLTVFLFFFAANTPCSACWDDYDDDWYDYWDDDDWWENDWDDDDSRVDDDDFEDFDCVDSYNSQDENNNQLTSESHKEMVLKWVASFNKELKSLIDKLTKEGKIKLMKTKNGIIVKTPKYDPTNGVIILPVTVDYGAESLTHEVIHYLQDMLKNLNYNISSSNNEYQAYVLNYLTLTAYGEHPSSPKFADASSWDYFINNLESHYGKDESGTIGYDNSFVSFIENFDHIKMLNSFADYYRSINGPEGYYKHINSNYSWKWSDLLNYLGFKRK